MILIASVAPRRKKEALHFKYIKLNHFKKIENLRKVLVI